MGTAFEVFLLFGSSALGLAISLALGAEYVTYRALGSRE
jgi:hypothetical protein